MKLLTYGPPHSLRKYVEYFWTFRSAESGFFPFKLFASDVSGLIVQGHDGRSALAPAGTQLRGKDEVPNAFVYGKRTRPGQLVARAPFELTGVVFRPQGLHALLQIDPAEVQNGPLAVDELLAGRLTDRLLNARTAQERLTALGRALDVLASDQSEGDLRVADGLRLLRTQVRTIRIPQVLKCVGLSERQFERRFRRAVGVSPHRYLRILRFQEALRLLRDPQLARMSDLACELGYTDQSHFIKEMKEFSGHTPTGLRTAVRTCTHLPCALIPLRTNGRRRCVSRHFAQCSRFSEALQRTVGTSRRPERSSPASQPRRCSCSQTRRVI
jgi:AraC-like DNA-binding protein